jgi:hypothetical protein
MDANAVDAGLLSSGDGRSEVEQGPANRNSKHHAERGLRLKNEPDSLPVTPA